VTGPVVPLLVAVLVALAVLLLARPGPVAPPRERPADGRGRLSFGVVASAAAALCLLLLGLEGTTLALALIVGGAAAGVLSTWRRGRRARAALERQTRVVELSEALVGELRAGQPVVAALRRGVEVWPAFAPVAAAADLGADVAGAMRRLARESGTPALANVASAWQVSERTGSSLARTVDQVASSAREDLATGRLVRSELASAQATARLVALLPVATLAMAAGAGGDPWAFLLTRPAGLACLATGVGLVLLGLWWIDRIASGVGAR
jgi:tight adherence protein B